MTPPRNNHAFAFLFGTFISSIGSTTLQISLMAFMKMTGFSVFEIGLIIGGARFVTLIASMILGDLADRIPARKLILTTELISVAISGALAWSWREGHSGFKIFLFLYLLRAGILAIQQPGRNKIAKQLSDETYSSNSRQAIWLNKVTHGSMFFAAGLSLLAIGFGSFYWAIAFDAFTFLVNSVAILNANLGSQSLEKNTEKFSLTGKFRDLYEYNSRTAILDLLLALALCGGNLFTVRMAGEHEIWLPVYLTSYGLAVWVTGYLERLEIIRRLHALVWLGFGASFLLLGQHPGAGALTWFLFILNDHCYWLLFHRYSSRIQANTPSHKIASVSSARIVQMILILATGEFVVGAWQSAVSLFWEGAWRAILCLLVAIALGAGLLAKGESNEKEAP